MPARALKCAAGPANQTHAHGLDHLAHDGAALHGNTAGILSELIGFFGTIHLGKTLTNGTKNA
jgi:hypothetical protein